MFGKLHRLCFNGIPMSVARHASNFLSSPLCFLCPNEWMGTTDCYGVTCKEVEFCKLTNRSSRLCGKITNHFRGIYGTYLEYNKGSKSERKNHNMYMVGLGNTRILIEHVQKSPQTLYGLAVRLQLEWVKPLKLVILSCPHCPVKAIHYTWRGGFLYVTGRQFKLRNTSPHFPCM